jgi:hypothetical protein
MRTVAVARTPDDAADLAEADRVVDRLTVAGILAA